MDGDMKITLFAVLAGTVVLAAGCVSTVSNTNTLATTWSQDSVAGRYKRTMDQVYQASIAVINQNGVVSTEYIPHDSTNNVRSLEGRVNDRKVWVRVSEVDPQTTQVDVEARSKWGVSDIDLVHELEKEIALQLSH
jgi:outer membrane murein-binding lipoprotein Lpp